MNREENEEDSTVPAASNIKRWMSEPTLLGDFDDDWIKRSSHVSEEGVSFTDEVVESSLTHVTKQRVQFRPKRRPPSREFIKSRASMDFEFAVPEQINEEDEDGESELEGNEVMVDDIKTPENGKEGGSGVPSPPQPVSSKPKDLNAWRLPTLEQDFVLRKTNSAGSSKRSEIMKQDSIPITSSETSDDSMTDLQHGSPDKKLKKRRRRPRIKLKFFKRRASHEKEEESGESTRPVVEQETKTEPNMNLRKCKSVDTGSRALGEDHTRSWLHKRWRRRSNDKRNLNWLLGLFHKKDNSDSGSTSPTTSQPTSQPTSQSTSRGDEVGVNEDMCNVDKTNKELVNGNDAEKDENGGHETVSDLRKRFEYMV